MLQAAPTQARLIAGIAVVAGACADGAFSDVEVETEPVVPFYDFNVNQGQTDCATIHLPAYATYLNGLVDADGELVIGDWAFGSCTDEALETLCSDPDPAPAPDDTVKAFCIELQAAAGARLGLHDVEVVFQAGSRTIGGRGSVYVVAP